MNEEYASHATTADGFKPDFMMKANGNPTLSQRHAELLEARRKIPSEIAAAHGLVTIDSNLAFEFQKGGALQYRKIRRMENGAKTFHRDRSNVTTCLWNVDCLEDAGGETVTITEGEFDALSFLTIGVPYVVSVPDGAQMAKPGEGDIDPQTDKAFEWLWAGKELLPGLSNAERIILATDDDDKGRILRDELAVRLGRERCYFVRYPSGCKDANDVLVKYGEDALIEVYSEARPIVPNKLIKASDFADDQPRESYSTGWSGMDEHFLVCPPELIVISGPPNHGKSQFALSLCARLAAAHGLRGAFLNFEDSIERNINDLRLFSVSNVEGVTASASAGPWIDEHFRFICPTEHEGDHDLDLKWLKEVIKEAATRHGCKWIVVDPWNEVEHMWAGHMTQAQYLNSALRQLKRLGRRYRIAIIIVAHPDKSTGQNATEIKDWNLYGLDGGAVWNNKADHGVIVYLPDGAKTTYVKICKSKDWRRMGKPAVTRMEFAPTRGDYKFVGTGA